jgi:hypothetical protein
MSEDASQAEQTVVQRLQEFLKESKQRFRKVAIIPDDLYKAVLCEAEKSERKLFGSSETRHGDLLYRDTMLLTQAMALDWLARHRVIRRTLA